MANFGNKGGRVPNQPAVPGTGLAVVGQFQIVAPNCKVCKSPHRAEVDKCLAMGWSQISVVRHFNQVVGEEYFSKDSMNRHANRHLSIRDAATRRVIESRARQVGMDVDEVEEFLTTKAGVLDAIVLKGLESLHSGATVVEAKDMIGAIQLLDRFEAEWKETAVDEMLAEFKAFTEAVKEVVGEEKYEEVFAAFERRLDSRHPHALNPAKPPVHNDDTIDGEIVSEEEEYA